MLLIKRLFMIVAILMSSLVLLGCSYFSKSNMIKESQTRTIPVIKVPAGLVSHHVDHNDFLNSQHYPAPGPVDLTPPGLR